MSLTGLTTFRGYRQGNFFKQGFRNEVEKASNAAFCFSSTQRWIAIRLDIICVSFGAVTASLAIGLRNSGFVSNEILVFSLTIVTDVILLFSISIRLYTELATLLTSSQRIVEYTKLPSEDELEKPGDKALIEANWPSKGEISFTDVSMRYREGLDPSLRNLDCKMDPGFKVGIVGRTGAGKSTILQVLFRMTELCGGDILIDG